jgi:hypothetical protein
MIHRAIGYGASFPDLYEWTWGELSSFIMAHMDHEKEQYRMHALMDMTQASIIARMFSGNSGKMTVMDVYSFLWTQEERQKAKVERLRAKMEAEARKGKGVN